MQQIFLRRQSGYADADFGQKHNAVSAMEWLVKDDARLPGIRGESGNAFRSTKK